MILIDCSALRVGEWGGAVHVGRVRVQRMGRGGERKRFGRTRRRL